MRKTSPIAENMFDHATCTYFGPQVVIQLGNRLRGRGLTTLNIPLTITFIQMFVIISFMYPHVSLPCTYITACFCSFLSRVSSSSLLPAFVVPFVLYWALPPSLLCLFQSRMGNPPLLLFVALHGAIGVDLTCI